MTPMIPKISVRPLATRNSSRPYWTAFRHWTRKVARSNASQGLAVRWADCSVRPGGVAPSAPARRDDVEARLEDHAQVFACLVQLHERCLLGGERVAVQERGQDRLVARQ